MRGFMFSIEMLGVMAVVIVVITAMLSFTMDQTNNTSILELKKSNQAMLLLYRGDDQFLELTGDNVYCKKMADYDLDFNKIVEKRYCGEIG